VYLDPQSDRAPARVAGVTPFLLCTDRVDCWAAAGV